MIIFGTSNMARPRKIYTALSFIILLIMLTLLSWVEHRINNDKTRQLNSAYVELQKKIIDKQLTFLSIYQKELQDTSLIQRKWSQLFDLAKKKNISLTVYNNKVPVLWTGNSNEIKAIDTNKDSLFVLQSENGYLLTYQINRASYNFIFTYLIKTNYSFKNQYIQNKFNDDLDFIKDGVISTFPIDNMVPITDITGKPIFYIQLFSFAQKTPLWLIILIIVLIFALIIVIHMLARMFIRQHFATTTILFFGVLAVIRGINTFYNIPDFIYNIKLFNPVIYASSTWLPSLGDLFIDSIIVLWYFVILESGKKRLHEYTSLNATSRSVFWFSLSILACHLSVASIKSLIIDSQISFDISNVLTNNYFIYICLITIILQLLIVYFIIRNFTRSIVAFKNTGLFKLLFYIFLGLIAYIDIAYQFVQITWYQLAIAVILFLSFFIFKLLRRKQNRFQQYFVVIFIIASIAAISIQHWVKRKEHENRKLYAISLVSQNDITTDYFLRNVEKKITSDQYVLNYFQNLFITKNQFEKRIRQIYFTGYLSKYEVNVLDYDSMGNHIRQRNIYTYKRINDMYNNQTMETMNNYFRYIKNSEEVKGYIAKFIIRKGNQISGILFILLKPKLIQDENRFDDLLIEGSRSNKKKDFNYSYAVYKDKFLIYQSGNFPYRTNNIWGQTNNNFLFFKEGNMEHLLYTDNQQLTVVVSKPTNSLMEIIGLFSFIFTGCTIFLILILFFHVAINAHSLANYKGIFNYIIYPIRLVFNKLLLINKPETLYIRTRIQTSIIFILFLTLLFTSYFTINFITQKYNSRQTERLMKKLRNVVLTIENENIHNYDWINSNELEAFINQIADFYDTDIILFNDKGKVIASSISKIYDEGIVSKMMPPMAYYHLNSLRESQFAEDENIALLHFQTAYAPVFLNKKDVLGYIQLPYFSQKADLQEEISSIVVGFINLYVLLFIIIGLIAYLISRNISSPLTLIQQKLGKTVLIGKNEPIIWQRDDEIGELVKQYNAMINQLAESARKLAETEREGAWRDIAKQIAHEIKNPLTPMKLSIQHLQRAFKNGDPNIAEKIDRTTLLLITQIDTLSDLATEFSSFAKMPAPVYEQIDVCHIIRQIKDLYSLNSDVQIDFNCEVTSEISFDPSYLNRIVGNLVKNAIQAIPENKLGHIKIHAFEDNEKVNIVVIDNGKGMSQEECDKIFMPYFSTKINGIGLGLPIVKNMIESGKGTIAFTSIVNEGTTFTITLPKNK